MTALNAALAALTVVPFAAYGWSCYFTRPIGAQRGRHIGRRTRRRGAARPITTDTTKAGVTS